MMSFHSRRVGWAWRIMPIPNLAHMDIKLQRLEKYCQNKLPIVPIHWIENGLCSCGSSNCRSSGKHPLVAGGFKSATTDFDQVRTWHEQWPQANWGMRTGDRSTGGSGLLVVDIDARSGGFDTWDQLRIEYMQPIETVTVSTGNGGQHLWFIYPGGIDIRSTACALGVGIDIRANDGYVLVPPSQTVAPYYFLLDPQDTEIDSCPQWILDMLHIEVKPEVARLPAGVRIGQVVPQGERHQALLTMAGAMRRVGMKSDEMRAALEVIRTQRFELGDHSVTDDELIDVVDWVSEKKRSFALTDLGNAERFVELFSEQVMYCYEWGQWLVWDGRRWLVNAEAEVLKLAHATVRSIYFEAAFAANDYQRKDITNHATLSESRHKIENMLLSAKPYLAVRTDQLDQHPMLLNVANGVVDLTTGELLAHDPSYLFTKLIDVVYDSESHCPEWEKFLDLVTGGDQDLQYFLQLAVGYTFTGHTDEHCLFVLYGTGSNGKTTFTEAIRLLLGDYAQRVSVESLMQSWGSGQAATPEVANMVGARFVLSSEIPENRKLNESLVKDLTGGDTITARKLFQNPFTFLPTHKLWIFGNHKPRVAGTDEGIWRRIRVVPFNVTIPKNQRQRMSEVLEKFQEEMPGILGWAVLGCLLWQAVGLPAVDSVQAATAEYRNEQDLLQQFLEEKCEMQVDYAVVKDELYKAWREWCEDAGEREASKRSKKWFTRQMTDRGFRHGGGQNRMLLGVKLKE